MWSILVSTDIYGLQNKGKKIQHETQFFHTYVDNQILRTLGNFRTSHALFVMDLYLVVGMWNMIEDWINLPYSLIGFGFFFFFLAGGVEDGHNGQLRKQVL